MEIFHLVLHYQYQHWNLNSEAPKFTSHLFNFFMTINTGTRVLGTMVIHGQTEDSRSNTFLLMDAFQDKMF